MTVLTITISSPVEHRLSKVIKLYPSFDYPCLIKYTYRYFSYHTNYHSPKLSNLTNFSNHKSNISFGLKRSHVTTMTLRS